MLYLAASVLQYTGLLAVAGKDRLPRYRHDKYLALLVHILVGVAEVWRQEYRLYQCSRQCIPQATYLDACLALAQSTTNLILVRPLQRGEPLFTRPCYQAGVLMRVALPWSAMYTNDPMLHTANVAILSGFVWTRAFLWLYRGYMQRYSELYTVAVWGAALLSFSTTPHSYTLSRVYVVLVALIAYLNRWTTRQMHDGPYGSLHGFIVALTWMGFSELEGNKYKIHLNSSKDEYTRLRSDLMHRRNHSSPNLNIQTISKAMDGQDDSLHTPLPQTARELFPGSPTLHISPMASSQRLGSARLLQPPSPARIPLPPSPLFRSGF